MKERKNLLILIIIVIVVSLGGYGLYQIFNPEKTSNVASEEAKEFRDDIVELASTNANGAVPIEGYEPGFLIEHIEKLELEDFDGVEAEGGKYKREDTGLVFNSTEESGVSSTAAKSISLQGYQTLLTNLKTRFNLDTAQEVLQYLAE